MNENFENNLKEIIKSLNTIYLALIAGLVMFFAVIITLQLQGLSFMELNEEMDYILNTSALLITIIAIPLGYYIFSEKAKKSISENNAETKLELYRTAKIIKYATFELAGFMNLMIFLLSQSKQSLLIFIVVIIIFFINRPSANNYYENFEE